LPRDGATSTRPDAPGHAERDRHSGTLAHAPGVVRYSRSGQLVWELPSQRVAVVGEFTIPALGDDYFLLFVTAAGECSHASFYAAGRDGCLAALAQELGSVLEPGLCNSTDFRSRVLWPPALLGQPLLEPTGPGPSGLLPRIAAALGLGSAELGLSSPVLAHLGAPRPDPRP
jgi:hypothetical protein